MKNEDVEKVRSHNKTMKVVLVLGLVVLAALVALRLLFGGRG